MIFMSQSGLTDPRREAEWDRWYLSHLEIMATVPGVASAQRFKTTSVGHSPSLGMYSFASAAVFQDPYYLSVRGMGEWLPLIDKRYYKRNLFAGLDAAPMVTEGDVLLVVDRPQPQALGSIDWAWLECVAIDRSTAYRGIAVVSRASAREIDSSQGIALYTPVSSRYARDSR
jgi:hypothetical protein